MLLWVLRALFVILLAGVSWAYVQQYEYALPMLVVVLCVGMAIVVADYLAPRRKLSILAGSFFGLIVGVLIAYALSFIVRLIIEQAASGPNAPDWLATPGKRESFITFMTIVVGCISCYLSISFVLQTKDDFRFIIPYVEFARQIKGARPIVLDTSVLIDGRIADVAATGVLETQLVVPDFVILELQGIADSGDKLRRNRGRRGLDVLARLQKTPRIDVSIYTTHDDDQTPVDQQLMNLARDLSARVLTTDFNLNKVAQLTGVDVVNLNDLANALKSDALPGERLRVKLVRPGEEPNQGVGFLDDGTMVVVEQARMFVGSEVDFVVTNTRQTSAGRMIFGRVSDTNDRDPVARRQPVRERNA